MNYVEWAKLNPAKTSGYRSLQKHLADVNERIATQEQIIDDARNGIAPQENMWTSFMSSATDHFLARMKATPWTIGESVEVKVDQERYEDDLISRKKTRHKESLEKAIKEATDLLNGYSFDFGEPIGVKSEDGLYSARAELVSRIRDYIPNIVDWREDLESVLHQRLLALGWYDGGAGEGIGVLDNAVFYFCDHYRIRATFRLEFNRSRWIASIGDETVHFTRICRGNSGVEAIRRALLSYIDARWEFFLEVFARQIEDES